MKKENIVIDQRLKVFHVETVLCDLRWNLPEPSTRNGVLKASSSSEIDFEAFLLMAGEHFPLALVAGQSAERIV